MKQPRFIFITGGIVSSLGKGITTAALGNLLQARGFKVKLRKLDPYLNIDPGTMSPIEHGEVFVTDDGAETDLDLGHYERFTGVPAKKTDCITAGKIYDSVLKKERKGEYTGETVQVIPHISNKIKEFILNETEDLDFVLYEIGGTVGDIEILPFLETIRQMRYDVGTENTIFIHLVLLPYLKTSGEIKTKPCQHSVKTLQSAGIQPDLLICRSEEDIDDSIIKKISLFCNVAHKRVIRALDTDNVYKMPLNYHAEGLDKEVCDYFKLSTHAKSLDKTLQFWKSITYDFHPKNTVKIGMVGKYLKLSDSYKSLIEALKHAACSLNLGIEIINFDSEDATQNFSQLDAILVPGGFGSRGIEGKISAIKYARENNMPFFGICLGAQLMCVEFARNSLHLKSAHSVEFDSSTKEPIVMLMKEWISKKGTEERSEKDLIGGTMRLGAYPCFIKPNTLAHKIYGKNHIEERHRHRYEINISQYKQSFEEHGMYFSGTSFDERLPEIIELKDHPFFIGVQFHPELKSSPFAPHPIFREFLKAASTKQNALKVKTDVV